MSASIRAVAVALPETVRTNDWFREHQPELVAHAHEATLAGVWADFAAADRSLYDRTLAPYLRDPFRGTVARRVMGPDDTAQSLSLAACRRALDAAGLEPSDIDLMLVNALRPDNHVVGDAAWLVKAMGLRAPAINYESACSSALVGLQLASDLVTVGRYRRVMVVTCCTYTRDVDTDDTFGWFLGDGAGAMIVEMGGDDEGLLGTHAIPTVETCGAFAYHLDDGGLRIRADRAIAGPSIREASDRYLRTCTDGAMAAAGVTLDDIDFLVVNTPTAWYGEFCARTLGFGMDRVVDNYPQYANIGPSLWINNLHTALADGRVRPGDLVLGYSVGSVSTATAVVYRMGEVAVGPRP
jgi:3-oxoacyl-[acyl-carrier-protein] synthase-3